jgi:hypothetical protein
MINETALQACKYDIQKDLGTLDDLPYELANTIANIYYRFWDLSLDSLQRARDRPGTWLPRHYDTEGDPLKASTAFLEEVARLHTDRKIIPRSVATLRRIDKVQQKVYMTTRWSLCWTTSNIISKMRVRRPGCGGR